MWSGLAAYRLGDYKTARVEGEAALTLKQKIGLDAELSRSFNSLGLVAWNEGRYASALENFDSAIVSARRHGDTLGIARATANIPLIQVELGNFAEARRGLATALEIGRRIKDDKVQGNALANLAMVEIRLGRASQALPLLEQARRHYRVGDYTPGEANALGQLATAWSLLGDLQQAIAAADSALRIARAQGLQQEVAAELEVIADLQLRAGNPRLALRHLFEADSIDAMLGLLKERGINLRRMSAILSDLGEAPASVARARDALAMHTKANVLAEVVYDRIQLARSLSRTNNFDAARAEGDSAIAAALRSKNPAANREAGLMAAQLALDTKQPRRALDALRRIENPRRGAMWELDDLRAQALLALGRLEDARDAGERALAGLERERASLAMGPLRSGYLQSRAAPFSHLVGIHLARRDTTAAFQVAASLAGRSLTERLGGVVDTTTSLASVAEGERILLRAAALEQQISELSDEPRDAARGAALNQQLEKARVAYEEHLARRATSANVRMPGGIAADLRDVQARLSNDEALLTFVSGPERLDVFVVRPKSVQHHSVLLGERALALRVRVARELLGQRRPETGEPAALSELYELLVGPALRSGALEGADRFLVVPHASLAILPFGALWDRRGGRFLIEEHVISYLPSVAALLSNGQGLGSSKPRMAVFAPIPDSLPGTRREVRAIGKIVSDAEVRLGSESSESAVRSALQTGRPIHIASHGVLNSQNPLFSRMTVGLRLGDRSQNDGRLDAHEILGLSTRSPLVFLSGCETGLGSGANGSLTNEANESSLAHAFLIAGAANVVATLWRVDDASAVQIATSFYQSLGTGVEPADALARAQRDAIRNRAGYTWAAYTVSGTHQRADRKFGGPVRRTGKEERTSAMNR